jgi:hypothetical protein
VGIELLQLAGVELAGQLGEDDLQGSGDEGQFGRIAGFEFAAEQRVGQLVEPGIVGGKQGIERLAGAIRCILTQIAGDLAQDFTPGGGAYCDIQRGHAVGARLFEAGSIGQR